MPGFVDIIVHLVWNIDFQSIKHVLQFIFVWSKTEDFSLNKQYENDVSRYQLAHYSFKLNTLLIM